MDHLVGKCSEMLLGTDEKLARGQGDAIRGGAVERLRSALLNPGGIRHSGNDALGRLDRIMLMRLDCRQFV